MGVDAKTGMKGVEISDAAAKRIVKVLAAEPGKSALRVSVEGGGCSGFSYKLDLVGFHQTASAVGVPFTTAPTLVHVDTHGQFGAPGESEWMAFLKDPAGNTVGLVERLPA